MEQKCPTPRNKREFTKIIFQIFVNFSLFPKELLLLPPFSRFKKDWGVTRIVMSQSHYSSHSNLSDFCFILLSQTFNSSDYSSIYAHLKSYFAPVEWYTTSLIFSERKRASAFWYNGITPLSSMIVFSAFNRSCQRASGLFAFVVPALFTNLSYSGFD